MRTLLTTRVLIWLLALAAGVGVVLNSRFSADMSFFLPAHPSAEQQVLVDQMKTGTVTRLLMLGIGGGTPESRATLSTALRADLAADPAFISVQNGERLHLDADRDFLLRHRYLLSPAVTPERWTASGLQQAIAGSIDLLSSPAGWLIKPYVTQDPTGELMAILDTLNNSQAPATRQGVWSSRDGERALLLIQTRALGSDTDGQEAAIRRIEHRFAELREIHAVPDATLQLSGPGRFAVDARATIKSEVFRLTLISSLAIIGVLWGVYRSLPLLAFGLLPVVSGALAGVVAVSLAYDTVFGITVGFGAALIGEAVDYSTYYFVQSGRMGLAAWRERFWPTIRLGVLTSVFGFGALLFSGFPGLAQLGLYSLAGVLTAAIVTRFVLPDLTEHWIQPNAGPLLPATRFEALRTRLGWLRGPSLLLTGLALGYLALQPGGLWTANLSVLSTVSAEDAAVDGALRADLGAPDSRYMVVVTAPSADAALAAAEDAGARLDRLQAAGLIAGYDSPTRFLPSQATQRARQASLPESAALAAHLAEATRDLPLRASKLQPFLTAVEQARHAPPLTRADLDGTQLALAVDALLMPRGDQWSVLLPLRPADIERGLPVAEVRAALAGSDALLIDLKGEFDTLYSDYLNEATELSLAGVLAIVVLLGAALRNVRRLFGVLLPLLMAVILVLAGLHALGESLHLLHLIGLLLIVAVGSNYALFFDRASQAGALDGETLTSMAVANLTTAIGFGTLALSSVPVLKAIGLTVGPGAILALLLAALFVPRHRAPA